MPLPAPRVASTPPLASLPAPREAPSVSVARFADPTLVYHRCGRATPSALVKPAPSTSTTRFADPALVYYRRKWATPSAPDDPPACTKPPSLTWSLSNSFFATNRPQMVPSIAIRLVGSFSASSNAPELTMARLSAPSSSSPPF
jgi:hypothetical protein